MEDFKDIYEPILDELIYNCYVHAETGENKEKEIKDILENICYKAYKKGIMKKY